MLESLSQKIQRSPYRNIYWFARYLMNTDQYGALGKQKEKQLLNVVALLENIMNQDILDDNEKLTVLKNTLTKEIMEMSLPDTKVHRLSENLIDVLNEEINSIADAAVFCITVKYVIAPINQALASVPSDDIEFCRKSAEYILDTLGE